MDFDEHIKVEGRCQLVQLVQLSGTERTDDQQNTICPHGSRFVHLIVVNSEVFAQQGQGYRLAHLH